MVELKMFPADNIITPYVQNPSSYLKNPGSLSPVTKMCPFRKSVMLLYDMTRNCMIFFPGVAPPIAPAYPWRKHNV